MILLSWFTGSALRIAIGVILSLLIAAVILVGINVILAFSGGPDPCNPGGGPITVDAANAAKFQEKWDAFDIILDGGSPSSVTFNESEVTSRADQYITDETDVDFKDIRICIDDGFGEATGSLEAILGLETDIKVSGTLDLTGDHPVAKDVDIEIGNVPGFITDAIEGFVDDAIDEALEDIELSHTYTPALTEGEAKIDGVPKP